MKGGESSAFFIVYTNGKGQAMDLTSIQEIKAVAKRFGFHFSKGLGQNFLLDPSVLQHIVKAAGAADGILEIGPGFGVLTRELAQAARKVVAVEIDNSLLPVLEYTLGEFDNVQVVPGDILKMDIGALLHDAFGDGRVSVAANLPYYITTPIITRLIESRLPFENIVVMVQKEVAMRLCAQAGTKDYGAVSVLCRYYTDAEIVARVPAASFYPPPKVDSSFMVLERLETPYVNGGDEAVFTRLVRSAFAMRRKTLLNNLISGFALNREQAASYLEAVGLSVQARAEELSLEDFAKLSRQLQSL